MRVKHLSESEIQRLLDRESRELSLDHNTALREHVDNCSVCRSAAENYSLLYDELALQPQVRLSAGFAQRVVAALPSPQLIRLPSMVEALSGLSVVLVASLIWLLSRIPWQGFATWSARSVITTYTVVEGWSYALIALVPIPEIRLPSIPIPDWTVDLSVFQRMTESLASNSGTANFLIFAAVVILLIGSVDRLLTVKSWNRW